MTRKIRLRNPESEEEYYKNDVSRIIRVLQLKDYEINRERAKQLWEAVSESFAAGWLALPQSDADLFSMLTPYFEVYE